MCVSWQIEKHWTLTQLPRMFKETQEESNVHWILKFQTVLLKSYCMGSEDFKYSSWLVWTTCMVLLCHFWTLTGYSLSSCKPVTSKHLFFYSTEVYSHIDLQWNELFWHEVHHFHPSSLSLTLEQVTTCNFLKVCQIAALLEWINKWSSSRL